MEITFRDKKKGFIYFNSYIETVSGLAVVFGKKDDEILVMRLEQVGKKRKMLKAEYIRQEEIIKTIY